MTNEIEHNTQKPYYQSQTMISHLYSLEQIRGISENYSNIFGMDSKTWCKPNLSYLSFDNSTLK